MNKLVVYTCVTNGYDSPSRPSSLPSWADWRQFSERDFPDNRQPKLLPHKVFPDYEYSLWLDGNIDVVGPEFWDVVDAMMSSGLLYAGIAHPDRDCVYEEAARVIKNGRDSLWNILRTVRFLRSEGFPEHWGMNENGVMLRRHNDPLVVKFDSMWWDRFKALGRRDQMTWGYCMWKTGLEYGYLIPKGENLRKHPWFVYTNHGAEYHKNLWRDALIRLKLMLYGLVNRRYQRSSSFFQ